MKPYNENIYRKARKSSGMTASYAAGLHGISEKHLYNYERYLPFHEGTCPSDEMVISMAKNYEAPWLLVEHLITTNKIIQLIFDGCEAVGSLPMSILVGQKEMDDVTRCIPEMIEVVRDGIIDDYEEPSASKYVKEVKELVFVLMSGIYSPEIKKHPVATGADADW